MKAPLFCDDTKPNCSSARNVSNVWEGVFILILIKAVTFVVILNHVVVRLLMGVLRAL